MIIKEQSASLQKLVATSKDFELEFELENNLQSDPVSYMESLERCMGRRFRNRAKLHQRITSLNHHSKSSSIHNLTQRFRISILRLIIGATVILPIVHCTATTHINKEKSLVNNDLHPKQNNDLQSSKFPQNDEFKMKDYHKPKLKEKITREEYFHRNVGNSKKYKPRPKIVNNRYNNRIQYRKETKNKNNKSIIQNGSGRGKTIKGRTTKSPKHSVAPTALIIDIPAGEKNSYRPSTKFSMKPSMRSEASPSVAPITVQTEAISNAPSVIPNVMPTKHLAGVPSMKPSIESPTNLIGKDSSLKPSTSTTGGLKSSKNTPSKTPTVALKITVTNNPSIQHPSMNPSIMSPTTLIGKDLSSMPSTNATGGLESSKSSPSKTPTAELKEAVTSNPSMIKSIESPIDNFTKDLSSKPSTKPSDRQENSPPISPTTAPVIFYPSVPSIELPVGSPMRVVKKKSMKPTAVHYINPTAKKIWVPSNIPSASSEESVSSVPSVTLCHNCSKSSMDLSNEPSGERDPSVTPSINISSVPSRSPIILSMHPITTPVTKPSSKSKVTPSSAPGNVKTFIPTTIPDDPSLNQEPWIDSFDGTIKVRLSTMTSYHTLSNKLSNEFYNERDRVIVSHKATKERISAHDILSGKETKLFRDVLTSIMTVFCNMPKTSEYVMLVPTSVVDYKHNRYVNYCIGNSLNTTTTLPQHLYDPNSTVLFADTTGKQGSLEVIDRNISISIGNNMIEKVHWIEWGVSYIVVQAGYLPMKNKGGNVMNAVTEINKLASEVLVDAWSAGIVNQVFNLKNSDIIATSIVGNEKETFTKTIHDLINNTNGQTYDNSNGNQFITFFINRTRIIGLAMFITLIASVSKLNDMAKKSHYLVSSQTAQFNMHQREFDIPPICYVTTEGSGKTGIVT